MDILENRSLTFQNWRFVVASAASGEENMRRDAEILSGVERRVYSPTLRLYRFKSPTVTFGRLQNERDVAFLVPAGWTCVQRPTGGGIVFHKDDLCLSLCWPAGQEPLPRLPQEQYRWIHSVILDALRTDAGAGLQMAACGDGRQMQEPFAVRTCFQNPVPYDVLIGQKKVVGGALRCTRQATLYQGSIQIPSSPGSVARLRTAFERRLM